MWPSRLLVAVTIFVVVYGLLMVPSLPRRAERFLAHERLRAWSPGLFARPTIALVGALLVVALGELAPRAAFDAIDWRTLALLVGMMLLVSALEAANAFAVLASALARAFPTPVKLLASSMVVVAVLSALVLNDAVVLLFTPVLIRAARAMGTSPFPFLVGEAFAANFGSAATPTGNPQNALIANAFDLSFVDFAAGALPVAAVAMVVAVAYTMLAFRRELRPTAILGYLSPERFSSRFMLVLASTGIALALAGFVFGPLVGIPLWASALAAGLFVALASGNPARIARGVDVGILAFFVGLFVLLAAVRPLVESIDFASYGSGAFVVATGVLSNLVSNVPAVILLLPFVKTAALAILLAVASTFAGNATFLGSAATVIVAESARSQGEEFNALRFTLLGLPLAAAALIMAWAWLG